MINFNRRDYMWLFSDALGSGPSGVKSPWRFESSLGHWQVPIFLTCGPVGYDQQKQPQSLRNRYNRANAADAHIFARFSVRFFDQTRLEKGSLKWSSQLNGVA